MDGRLIRQVVLYIIDNHTIDETVEHFKLSRGTIIKYANLVRTKGPYFNYELANQLEEAMKKNSEAGRKKGGQNGHIAYVITNELALIYAKEILEKKATLREIAEKNNLNVATLYNSLMRIEDKEVLKSLKDYYSSMASQREESWKR